MSERDTLSAQRVVKLPFFKFLGPPSSGPTARGYFYKCGYWFYRAASPRRYADPNDSHCCRARARDVGIIFFLSSLLLIISREITSAASVDFSVCKENRTPAVPCCPTESDTIEWRRKSEKRVPQIYWPSHVHVGRERRYSSFRAYRQYDLLSDARSHARAGVGSGVDGRAGYTVRLVHAIWPKRAAVDRIACSSSLPKPAHAYCFYLICTWHNYLCDLVAERGKGRERVYRGIGEDLESQQISINQQAS